MNKREPFSIDSFPQAILHIDGDAFFASCEQAMNPALRGKPVVTGSERGIASAMSYEAKARGVTRGMAMWEIKKVCPDVIIMSSNYELYSMFAARVYEIVRRYTNEVEEYSIDECFADITGMRRALGMSYEQIAEKVKQELEDELGVTFSIGLAPTKVLAKIGSNFNKPSGFTSIPANEAHLFLEKTPIEKVWGIGKQTSTYLKKFGIVTAYDYANRSFSWITNHMSKPYIEIYQELRAIKVLVLNLEEKHDYKSISKTKTFTPPSQNPDYIFAQLSKNIENACIKARRHHLRSDTISVFLKTQEFKYHAIDFKLSSRVNTPTLIIGKVRDLFNKMFVPGVMYRGTGITMKNLEYKIQQPDLFGEHAEVEKYETIYSCVDDMSHKYGKHTIYLGGSNLAHSKKVKNTRNVKPTRHIEYLLAGENERRRINIPWLGMVV